MKLQLGLDSCTTYSLVNQTKPNPLLSTATVFVTVLVRLSSDNIVSRVLHSISAVWRRVYVRVIPFPRSVRVTRVQPQAACDVWPLTSLSRPRTRGFAVGSALSQSRDHLAAAPHLACSACSRYAARAVERWSATNRRRHRRKRSRGNAMPLAFTAAGDSYHIAISDVPT